ncbi:MAG: Ig-like domain-containing protein, partial [Spirochaetaceae bacterium]|nr:Ig-like domain-containing protein [Spirochaetaceae bacterium]
MANKLYAIILISFLALFSFSCKKAEQAVQINSKTVSAFTGGIISPTESIKIIFNDAYDTTKPATPDLFQLKPSAQGKISWENDWTLVFTPSKPLKPQTRYQAIVDISKISEKESAPFYFEFETQVPLLEVDLDSIKIDESGMVLISGSLTTDKRIPITKLERIVSSKELGKIEWNHKEGIHHFSFNPIERKNK